MTQNRTSVSISDRPICLDKGFSRSNQYCISEREKKKSFKKLYNTYISGVEKILPWSPQLLDILGRNSQTPIDAIAYILGRIKLFLMLWPVKREEKKIIYTLYFLKRKLSPT